MYSLFVLYFHGKYTIVDTCSEMTGMQNLICFFKLLLRPWGLSHRVERQKLMVNSREEMSVRVRKGGFVAKLFVRSNFGPMFYLKLCIRI